MVDERQFPSRLLSLDGEGLAAAPSFDPERINQHLEGRTNGKRIMQDDEVERLLNDPFAALVLRRKRFPANLTELLDELDKHNGSQDGLPETSSFLVSEGGQIPFQPGISKGGVRLLTVRSRHGNAELLISTLTPDGVSPRSSSLLIEVIAWDPVNRTFHFYQRQSGTWFWCGQSDMAFDDDTRGNGPFDSHINGYPNMKELKTPWVHWHGPSLSISETAFAPDDPLISDPLFQDKEPGGAEIFERLIRPLMDRWNAARFAKAVKAAGGIGDLKAFVRQVVDSTSFNLITTHTKFSHLATKNLDDVPVTFFIDQDSLVEAAGVGLSVDVPRLTMSRQRYAALIDKYDLRVRAESIDLPGDVPFCFAVPERAREDILVVHGLIANRMMSKRLAACLLMIDVSNPLKSPLRASLLSHVPEGQSIDAARTIDDVLVARIHDAVNGSADTSAERRFKDHWDLGPDGWQDVFADRIETYLRRVADRLRTDDGCDEIFRLAESRRREISGLPLLEFDLTLPFAAGILETSPALEMTETADVQPRA